MTPLEEIKSKLAIEQIIGEYVNLKQAGTSFKGLCPFHQEKTPSFMVSPEKQIWHCFGCNEGGDVISFLQKHEGMEFKEAVENLARRAGVALTGWSAPDQSKKKILYEAHEEARAFYERELHGASDASVKTLAYLETRGVADQTIRSWQLGLAPDSWDALLVHLRAKKFSDADIVAAGLAVSRDGKLYDRFRRRLLFPINDVQGRTVGFTARTLQYIVYQEEDIGGKYINSPQTVIYNKSQILYGFDKAKHDIKRMNYAIIVEGNMDALMSHQAGIKNVIAASGTALTSDQLRTLSRYTKNIILSFDADTAGSQAVFRGITLAWDHDMNVKVIILSEGKDPAEIIQKDPELWRTAIKESVGVVDFYLEAVCARVDLTRADHKKQAAQKIAGIIARLKTQVEREHYVEVLSRRLGISTDSLWPLVKSQNVTARGPEKIVGADHRSPVLLSQHLLAFMVTHPAHAMTVINDIEPDMLAPDMQELYKKVIVQYTKDQSHDFSAFSSVVQAHELKLWSETVFVGEQVYASLQPREQEQELLMLMQRIKNNFYTLKLRELTEAIRVAERAGEKERLAELLGQYNQFSALRKT